tara:strand:- start:1133 stop:1366 length:234 start_codon:yes stop_codon:yes gene_type:complete
MTKKIVDGVVVDLTSSDISQQEADALANTAYHTANGYKLQRQIAYPSIEDQLDKIFHDGIDAWKSDIQAIKNNNPKP